MNKTEQDLDDVEEELTLDKLAACDRPSIYALGLMGAQSLRKAGIAVFMTDVLGRILIMPPGAVEVKNKPRISIKELDGLSEDEAIQILTAQGDSEDTIIEYLKSRKGIEVSNGR